MTRMNADVFTEGNESNEGISTAKHANGPESWANVDGIEAAPEAAVCAGVSKPGEKPGTRDWIEAEQRKRRGLCVEGWEEWMNLRQSRFQFENK